MPRRQPFFLIAAVLLLLLCTGFAAAAPQALARDVYLLPGRFEPGRQPDGNSVLLRGTAGEWLLIDSGRHRAHAQALLDFIGAAPLPLLINTHWHLDHLGGNALLKQARPQLRALASPAVARALDAGGWLAGYREQLRQRLAAADVPAAERATLAVDLALLAQAERLRPDETVDTPARRTLAGRALRIGVERAVSGGDLWLLDEASATLVAGDLVTLPVPFLDTACAEEWLAALARLEALPFERLVPGHGPVLERAGLQRYRAAMAALLACAAGQESLEACSAGWLEGMGPLLDAAERPRALAMLGYYFNVRLRAPAEQARRFCGAAAVSPP